MADWAANLLSTTKANLPDLLRDYSESAVKLDPTSDTNIITGALRYRPANRLIERWSGAAWQDLDKHLGTAGGTANALTLTPTVALTAYATGQRFSFSASLSNTAAATINMSGLGTKNIKRFLGAAKYDVIAGNISINSTYEILYDGTDFLLLNPDSAIILARALTEVLVSNTTTETTIFSTTLKGGTLGLYKGLRLTHFGRVVNNDAVIAPTTKLRVKLGSTQLYEQTDYGTNQTKINYLNIEGIIQAMGSASAQHSLFTFHKAEQASESVSTPGLNGEDCAGHYSSAENSANDLTLLVSAQLSNADPDISYQAKATIVELL